MPNQIRVEVARQRNKVLRDLAADKNLEFRKNFIGRTLEVITLQNGATESTEALSDNYLKVNVAGRHPANTWMNVDVTGIENDGLAGPAARRGGAASLRQQPSLCEDYDLAMIAT